MLAYVLVVLFSGAAYVALVTLGRGAALALALAALAAAVVAVILTITR
jgi:hypothetical protein